MKIQIDIPFELNKELKKYRIDKDLNNMGEAIIIILKEKFEWTKEEMS